LSNHLKDETSPYLLQHAENPVDWYPWGEEAFLKARETDKPIFLSIGYQAYTHELEKDDKELSNLFAKFAEDEAMHAAKLLELLRGYEK
jgi:hypothetical protein